MMLYEKHFFDIEIIMFSVGNVDLVQVSVISIIFGVHELQ